MKKLIYLFAFMPSLLLGQSITNTLGVGGNYVVESNAGNDAVLINPAISRPFIFGIQPSGFATTQIPDGTFNFINEGGSTFFNITTAKGGAPFATIPKFEFMYQNGTFASPTAIIQEDVLGLIGFGGYTTSRQLQLASISAFADSSLSGANAATRLEFLTRTGSGTVRKMILTKGGSLEVDGSITSKAIKSVSANYIAQRADQVIVATAALTITLPAVSAVPKGKLYTIKKGNIVRTITINTTSSQNIDSVTSTTLAGTNTQFITVQSDGTQWWVIAQGNGI